MTIIIIMEVVSLKNGATFCNIIQFADSFYFSLDNVCFAFYQKGPTHSLPESAAGVAAERSTDSALSQRARGNIHHIPAHFFHAVLLKASKISTNIYLLVVFGL